MTSSICDCTDEELRRMFEALQEDDEVSTKAQRQARKRAEADLRDARRDLQFGRFAWAGTNHPVEKATFARSIAAAKAREAEAESRLANLR